MDELCERILRVVEEHNTRKEKAYLDILAKELRGFASKPTISSRIKQLVDEGRLVQIPSSRGRSTYKDLYIPGMEDPIDPNLKLENIQNMLVHVINILEHKQNSF